MRVLVVVLVVVVLLLVTGINQSQLLGLRLSLEFDKIWVDDPNGGGAPNKTRMYQSQFCNFENQGWGRVSSISQKCLNSKHL